ncbi:hypothetical protein pclt_cds_757 [Pandoravirus celtis]|uniref:Uncharacterized protein n=1 Tax=Pandoravirus celtis TaxID=2568002 RepID=A0A4D6EJ37_9VIRU|nr:hypothetical protein pclt_cds_757 [Pandoravirus celtis]
MRRFACLSNRTTLAAPIVGGVFVGLVASYRSTISADTIDVPWDGQGECPIAHPFGTGINRLDKAIRHAEETDDLASVQRLYQFVLAHMHKEFTLVEAAVTVHHASHQWSGRSVPRSIIQRARWPTGGMTPTGRWPTATDATHPCASTAWTRTGTTCL